MQPLYSTTTILTFSEYKKMNKAVFSASKKITLLCFLFFGILGIINRTFYLPLLFVVIYYAALLGSLYLVRREFATNKSLQNQKFLFDFYDTFFTMETAGNVTKIFYNELNLILETKQNFYLSRAEKFLYPVIKANCSAGLIQFLQNPELKNIAPGQAEPQENNSDTVHTETVSGTPLFETVTIYNQEEYSKLQQYILCKRSKFSYVFLLLFLTAVGVTIYLKEYLYIITICLVAASLAVGFFMPKFTKSFLKIPEETMQFYFYDNHLCKKTAYESTDYYYKNLFDILETDTNFYIKISSLQYLILVKNNCSPELTDFIHGLKRHCLQTGKRNRSN